MESSKMVTEREGFVRSNEFARFEKGRSTVSGTDPRTDAGREGGAAQEGAAVAQIAGGLLRLHSQKGRTTNNRDKVQMMV